jgi:hypothetical protein
MGKTTKEEQEKARDSLREAIRARDWYKDALERIAYGKPATDPRAISLQKLAWSYLEREQGNYPAIASDEPRPPTLARWCAEHAPDAKACDYCDLGK